MAIFAVTFCLNTMTMKMMKREKKESDDKEPNNNNFILPEFSAHTCHCVCGTPIQTSSEIYYTQYCTHSRGAPGGSSDRDRYDSYDLKFNGQNHRPFIPNIGTSGHINPYLSKHGFYGGSNINKDRISVNGTYSHHK